MSEKNDAAEDLQDANERGYIAGHRAAWTSLLQQAIGELRDDGAEPNDPLLRVAALTKQLEQTRAALRKACEEFGDNSWPDDLNLGDVVEKYLVPYLGDE